ncbi:MAG TPA: EAL domain-containing protein [Nocardioidaceae bacterium]|nr:EAL domain-containing protein [Nocardioidaceae bacterium]
MPAGTLAPGYGTHAARLLEHAWVLLEPQAAACVDAFYDRLCMDPDARTVLDRLTDTEHRHLRTRQLDHLHALLDPAATPASLEERCRTVGRIHAMAGVEMDWYAASVSDYQQSIFAMLDVVADPADRAGLREAVSARFLTDVRGALQGYRDIDMQQSDVMLEITSTVMSARTVADLVQGVLDALARLDGYTVGFFGRPAPDGRVRFEMGAGNGAEDFVGAVLSGDSPLVTVGEDQPSGRGPIGRAWRTGQITRSDSYLTDPSTVMWAPLAQRFGWRTSAAVPLVGPDGRTRAAFTLYARWPGYFGYRTRRTMLAQVKQMAERALLEIESRRPVGTGFLEYAEREAHVARLEAGEVQMLYQPVVALPSGRVSKFEALARLRSEDGLVGPGEFLSAFGDDELLRLFEIGVRDSLQALNCWERHGVRVGVSVNLPINAAHDRRYVRLVRELLADSGIEPGRLTLELLETGLVHGDLKRGRKNADEFHELGVRLAQDDLGSGHSSLLRLRHYDFDEVKIDQHLVRGNEIAPRAALHFIQPVTDIAHSMGLTVVAEGLEDDGLIEASVQLGVDEGQGYALARPMPAAQVPGFVSGFTLDVDPAMPRTPLGALAAHVSWEHKITALGPGPLRADLLGIDNCVLTGFIERHHDADALDRAHRAVHHEAARGRGSRTHRRAWQQLATLIGEA